MVAKISSKCLELADEESRMVNGGGPSVWDSYNGTRCPYDYTTVSKETTEETSSQITSTPANKIPKLPESTAMDVTNQTEQDVEKVTGSESKNTTSATNNTTTVSQTPIVEYVRKVVNEAFEV